MKQKDNKFNELIMLAHSNDELWKNVKNTIFGVSAIEKMICDREVQEIIGMETFKKVWKSITKMRKEMKKIKKELNITKDFETIEKEFRDFDVMKTKFEKIMDEEHKTKILVEGEKND